MRSIEWNERADRFLSPLQRDAFERGDEPRRLEGQLVTDKDGLVWYYDGHGNERIVGTETRAHADKSHGGHASESHGKSKKHARKRRK